MMAKYPLRIGVDVRELQYGMGGIARYLLNILRVLIETYNKVILFTNNPSDLENLNAEIVVIPSSRIPLFEDQISLCNAVRKANLDLFLSPYYKLPLFINCKSAITIHDFSVLKAPVLPPLFLLYFRITVNIYSRKANIIFTVSECSKRHILNYIKTDEEKVKVIYNMVSDEFRPDYDLSYQKYGLSEKYILYISNLCPHKNLKTLLHAYALLEKDLKKKYQLAIVGKTKGIIGRIDQRAQYLKLISLSRDLGIIDNVHFIEFVEEKDLPGLYTHAEVLVLPSYYEGFSLPVVEAMACGCPVIGANRASIPEVAGDAAVLFNPDDYMELAKKMEKVLTDYAIRNELRTKGLKRAENFRYENIKRIVKEAIDSILK
jgi:glycosyltransferase involved in cell wall biosynthesis